MSIATAIQGRNLLSFMYDVYRRTVEPHTYGMDTKGHTALRAYQVGGGSESGEYIGWKLFHANEMHGVTVQPQTFAGPAFGLQARRQGVRKHQGPALNAGGLASRCG